MLKLKHNAVVGLPIIIAILVSLYGCGSEPTVTPVPPTIAAVLPTAVPATPVPPTPVPPTAIPPTPVPPTPEPPTPIPPTPVPPTPIPQVANCSVTFHTNDDDKDHDTLVTVHVRDENNVEVAYLSDYFGHFNDQSTNGPFQMAIHNPSTIDTLTRGTVSIRITPNGHDTWKFNFHLDCLFSDNQHRTANNEGMTLNQNQNEASFGLEGKLK